MKIFIIHSYYQQRGGEAYVVEHELSLLQKSHETFLYHNKNKKGLHGLIQTFFSPWNIFEAKKILQAVNTFKPDVIHIHNLHYSIGPYVIRKLQKTGIPMVKTIHNFRLVCPSAVLAHHGKIYLKSLDEDFPWSAVRDRVHVNSYIKTFWLAWTYWLHKKMGTWQKIDKYIVLSNFAKQIFLKTNIGIVESQFVLKVNSVEDFLEKSYPQRKSHFLYVGRLSEEKGIIPLIKALRKESLTLKIAGDGPLKEEVIHLIEDSNYISYLGQLNKEQLKSELAECTALIVPSTCFEGLPLTILESFSAGNIVFASKLGALKDIISEKYNGFLFNLNNPNEVVQLLKDWLTADESTKTLMRQNARKEYLSKYTDYKNIENLISIYSDLV